MYFPIGHCPCNVCTVNEGGFVQVVCTWVNDQGTSLSTCLMATCGDPIRGVFVFRTANYSFRFSFVWRFAGREQACQGISNDSCFCIANVYLYAGCLCAGFFPMTCVILRSFTTVVSRAIIVASGRAFRLVALFWRSIRGFTNNWLQGIQNRVRRRTVICAGINGRAGFLFQDDRRFQPVNYVRCLAKVGERDSRYEA